jgi:DNA-binding transcriptional regulator LsrR (DeoR family)/DNA-binding Xre family transcriptional regulator
VPKDRLRHIFSGNLREQLHHRGLTQKELAEAIGRSPALVSCWATGSNLPRSDDLVRIADYLNCSIDCLFSRQQTSANEQTCDEFKWVEYIPLHIRHISQPIGPFLEEEIKLGIRLFRTLVVDRVSAKDCIDPIDGPFPNQSWHSLNRAFKAATLANALSLTYVPRDSAREQTLRILFPHLRQVIVAALPRDNYGIYLDNSVIRAEFVAFLAATQALTGMPLRSTKVGIGAGYTLMRLAQLVIPTSNWFAGTQWIPLNTQRINEDYSYSANQVATTLSHRCLGSKALPLPFVEPEMRRPRLGDHPTLNPDEQRSLEAVLNPKDISAMFVSVSGINQGDVEHFVSQGDFYSSDGEHVSRLYTQMYAELQDQGIADQAVGEMLGHMFDAEGRLLGTPEWQRSYDKVLFAIGFEDLRRAAATSYVWLIAAGHNKRKAVLAAVSSKLVNSLVIECDIADYLIQARATR